MDKHEAGGASLVFLFGAATSYLSLQMPIGTFRAAGSGLFPLCLGVLLMALSGAFVLRLLFQEQAGRKTGASGSRALVTRVVPFLGAIVAAILLLEVLGYPLMSFLLLAALLRILGMKKWKWNVLLAFGTAGISYLLFVQWLKIPLPKGWLGL